MHLEHPVADSNAMRSSLAILQGEHASYGAALKTLLAHLKRARAHSFMPNLEIFAVGLSYIDTFIEQFHHPKEDEILFPALRQRTGEADDVMRELQFDHANGTFALKELNAALDHVHLGGLNELHRFADMMERYTQAQHAHMQCEERLVLPLARRFLVEEDWIRIDCGFRANRDPLFGAEGNRKFGILFRSVTQAVE